MERQTNQSGSDKAAIDLNVDITRGCIDSIRAL